MRIVPCCFLYLCGFITVPGVYGSAKHTATTASIGDTPSPTLTAPQLRVTHDITLLASARWNLRRRAERRLLSAHGFILPQLAAAINMVKNLEQRDRLLRICLQLYLRQFNWLHHGTAFIGFEFIAQPLELRPHGQPHWIPAVAVVRTVNGFPGGLYLHENDLIIGLNGHSLPAFATATALRSEIQKYQPGATVTLQLFRNGKLCKVKVRLAGIPLDPLAGQELLNQRNVIAQHLIHKYIPDKVLVLSTRNCLPCGNKYSQ
ncbi:MAG: hypothetical protein ACP5VQ_10390 [Phycisphaerae bacterium]